MIDCQECLEEASPVDRVVVPKFVSDGFIVQTALDYDMEVSEVKRVIRENPNNIYEGLELFIKRRAEA
jgi:hypothetical protein